MRFRTRLLLAYSVVVIVLVMIMMLLFRQYNIRRLEENASRELEMLSESVLYQLDEIVRPMEFIGDFLLSDSKTLSAINTLSGAERAGMAQLYIMHAKQDIKRALATYCINKSFYNVNVFSGYGDLISSGSGIAHGSDGTLNVHSFPALTQVYRAMGSIVLIPPHSDTWSSDSPETVFSMVRAVRGGTYPCYIEVQKSYSVLKDIFDIYAGGDNRIAIFCQNGDMFFSQLSDGQNACLSDGLLSNGSLTEALKQYDGSMSAVRYSSYTGMHIIALQNRDIMANKAMDATSFAIYVFILIGFISIGFVYITSSKLTGPIRRLTAQMKQTTLDNIEEEMAAEHPNDEIEALNITYNHLMRRLNQAAFREKQLGALQVQTEFDALQAQVNPHFIYNVLNMIAHRGLLSGDETVCDMCDNLAGMLRYSTGTSQRVVTLQMELDYINQYFYLLKTRYRDKLNCSVNVDPSIYGESVPKIVLQQIAENSIHHGFKEHSGEMQIMIDGWVENGHWFLRVSDNGSGFDEDSIQRIERKMDDIRKKVSQGGCRMEFDIGGMGLINAYARLLLIFRDRFVFRVYNKSGEEHGAVVVIGAAMGREAVQ